MIGRKETCLESLRGSGTYFSSPRMAIIFSQGCFSKKELQTKTKNDSFKCYDILIDLYDGYNHLVENLLCSYLML